MTNDGSLPSEEQLDAFFDESNVEELSDEVEETPQTEEEEQVTLSQEEYDELKKGQMLQADYTRKRQMDANRVRELEAELAEERQVKNLSDAEFDADLDDSDLPDSVKAKVTEIDKIKKELEQQKLEREQEETSRKANEIVRNLKDLEEEYPALRSKAVKFSVMAYASQVLNNSSKQGFRDAAKEISKAYNSEFAKKQQELTKQVKQRRATSPSVGSGGSAPMRNVEAPQNLTEANELVMDALAKMNAIDSSN